MGVAIEDLALIQSHSDTRIARGVNTADPIGLETQRTLNSLQVGFNMANTGDMVQQNQNAGIAGHRNPTSCRVCMIDRSAPESLDPHYQWDMPMVTTCTTSV